MESYLTSSYFAGKKVHLAVCGSVSAYKAVELLRECVHADLRVTVSLTASACKFIRPLSFSSLGAEAVYTSMFRPEPGQADAAQSGAFIDIEEFAHLTPGAECQAFALVPATATTLARLATGFADEIVSAQALAFPGPLLIAPAMNPRMWGNASTRANCDILQKRGHQFVYPGYGKVACGDEGEGKLADLREIYLHILKMLAPQDMTGRKILLTLGPTQEQWDGVRYWSNHSSGVMGSALAVSAWLRGAQVTALCGPGAPWLPEGIVRRNTVSAREMHAAALEAWPGCDVGICTAAVADFFPEFLGPEKFKKSGAGEAFSIPFKLNPDILADMGKNKRDGQTLVGFAAETGQVEENARQKLTRKNADVLVGNLVGVADSGFGSATNKVFITDKNGREEGWPVLPKSDVAWRILDWLLTR